MKQEVEERGPLPIAEVTDIGRQILAGLDYAHHAGVVHRDMKPDNVMRLAPDDEGSRAVKILDFGIVKIKDDQLRNQVGDVVSTAAGLMLGTPQYAAPEQIAARPVDARTDV